MRRISCCLALAVAAAPDVTIVAHPSMASPLPADSATGRQGTAQRGTGPDGPYDPSPEHPFGRPNPDAPAELAQFAFMVGEFDCFERLRQQDGSWAEFNATWHGFYFLNGMGIIDRYWNGRFATSNARVYDPQRQVWGVTYFQMPSASSGRWEGEREGDTMVMRQAQTTADGAPAESRLTFYDISDAGYEWKAEFVVGETASSSWTSSCRRRTSAPLRGGTSRPIRARPRVGAAT